ncbi:hypothetical protein E1B28_003039 [Marasmius oreades]|uniref:Nephrocystin 3-like N-terminal domain-containing protein n=1 Tax=Marasmius oreades TaxID=181124 RepID=A0A9P7RLB7_9AGAR|nr:uncharacterized protein E1B28_003039 [Marasmius oreades]KAG7085477.1 hypothetical protein E1B28_003039 [Marasmius oreades]
MGQAVFNNVGRDLNHNYYAANPLWDAIADIGASHNSEQQVERGRCLPGTRQAVLQLIHNWRTSEGQHSPVCWLSGAAGVGKSAIALTVAEECEKDGLVASFFFFRTDPKRNNPSSLILSIAHGLVVTRPDLKPLVDQKITADPSILKARLEKQYEELVLEHVLLPCSHKSPDLIIIDGLDECSDAATQGRPESWIKEEFSQFHRLTKHIQLDDSFLPRYNIELYLDKGRSIPLKSQPNIRATGVAPTPNQPKN